MKFLFLFLAGFPFFSGHAQTTKSVNKTTNSSERPKLVIGLVIDQMRWDYLTRYHHRFGEGGFKKLLKNGYSYDNTFIPYSLAVTSAGHACLYTGSVPAFNGVVGNNWMENGNPYYCADDSLVQTVGSSSVQGRMSPRSMLSTTIGDELRMATNFRSRVYSVSMKDRGAIFPAGHSANGVYWFDDSTGGWISSSYYMKALPEWVNRYNSKKLPDSMMRSDWKLLYSDTAYIQSDPDDLPYERTLSQEKRPVFPHSYQSLVGKNYAGFRYAPYGNTYTLDFARRMIEEEKLGSTQTDMLCISLSSTDYLGHRFGPNAIETEDMYLRLDQDLENFLSYLDRKMGKGNYILFMSSDHGAPNSPGFMVQNKLPGGSRNAYRMAAEINRLLSPKYKTDSLTKVIGYQVYLNKQKIDHYKLDREQVKKDVLAFLYSQPEVIHAFSYDDFDKVVLPPKVKEMYALGYFPKRSGDIQFMYKSQYTDVQMTGTDHSSWYRYDTHIPLVWYGWKIPAGFSNREVYMTDVAPTLCALLKIQMPGASIGSVLPEIVQPVNKK